MDMLHTPDRRFFLKSLAVSATGIALPGIARSQSVLPPHFFVGCFYDTALSQNSMAERYLIAPIRRDVGSDRTGSELTPFVRDIVYGERDFGSASNLQTTSDVGNPIALALTRAQHEVEKVTIPGLPTEYVVRVSVTVSLDIMTDQAAFKNMNQFETLYCTMVAVTISGERRTVTDTVLSDAYRDAFAGAVRAVLANTTRYFKDRRDNAKAVFQVKNMVLPQTLPAEIEQLIAGGLEASGETGQSARDLEIRKLGRELQHYFNFKLKEQLEAQKINDLVLLPPSSPWTDGNVLSILKKRLGITADILTEPDANKVNGFEIRAGIISEARTKITGGSRIDMTVGTRIVRRSGDQIIHVPNSIADPTKKTAVGSGVEKIPETADFKRAVPRDKTMATFEHAAKDAATALVPLMIKASSEI